MFAGKSEELLRRINLLQYADVDYLLFKPKVDTRTKSTSKSRDGRSKQAIVVTTAIEILDYVKKHDCNKEKPVIAIDEAQFFDEHLGDICEDLANCGYIVYVAGLDMDFRGEPFPSMLKLLAYAEKVIKLTAICTVCGAPATKTQRLIDWQPAAYNTPVVKIGNTESYTARCRHHHMVKDKPTWRNK
jgi:thymidine kinase